MPPFQMSQSREDSVYLAKLAEQAERYEGLSTPRVHPSIDVVV